MPSKKQSKEIHDWLFKKIIFKKEMRYVKGMMAP